MKGNALKRTIALIGIVVMVCAGTAGRAAEGGCDMKTSKEPAAKSNPAEAPKEAAIEPKAGELVDFAPWCYTDVKGAATNPPESRWVGVTPNMLCGLLWESSVPASSLVIKFVSDADNGNINEVV